MENFNTVQDARFWLDKYAKYQTVKIAFVTTLSSRPGGNGIPANVTIGQAWEGVDVDAVFNEICTKNGVDSQEMLDFNEISERSLKNKAKIAMKKLGATDAAINRHFDSTAG